MTRKKTNYDVLRDKVLSNPKAREYYDSLQPEREMILAIMEARSKQGLTQQDLANRAGIDRADISKIENGNANPTLKTMQKLARALNSKLEIKIVPVKY